MLIENYVPKKNFQYDNVTKPKLILFVESNSNKT